MTAPFTIDKEMLYEIADGIITGLLLIFGFRYLRQIISMVLEELYHFFIEGGIAI